MTFEFERHRRDKFSKEYILDQLEIAARYFKYIEFSKRDLKQANVGISSSVVVNAFDGSWSNAIETLRLQLKNKGIELRPRTRFFISETELFIEMERIWSLLGHRPSKDEWNENSPKYSYNVYKQRFDGWQNACLAFIENRTGEHQGETEQSTTIVHRISPEAKRDIPPGLRLKVYERDKYTCVFCGRSRLKHNVVLHADHIIPFSKGGKTIFENIQTLCSECNLGKSASTNISGPSN